MLPNETISVMRMPNDEGGGIIVGSKYILGIAAGFYCTAASGQYLEVANDRFVCTGDIQMHAPDGVWPAERLVLEFDRKQRCAVEHGGFSEDYPLDVGCYFAQGLMIDEDNERTNVFFQFICMADDEPRSFSCSHLDDSMTVSFLISSERTFRMKQVLYLEDRGGFYEYSAEGHCV